MGDGIGKAFFVLNVLVVVGIISVLGGISYGMFKVITWIF